MQTAPIVLIFGGAIRRHALAKLRAHFPAYRFEWIPTRESDPAGSHLAFPLRLPGIIAVVSLVGLVRHQHHRRIVELCRAHKHRLVAGRRSANPALLAEYLR